MDIEGLGLTATQLIKVIDNCWDGILIIDKHSKVQYVNKSFLLLIGYSKDKMIGAPFDLFLHSKSQELFEKLLAKVESTDVQSFIKVLCKSKDDRDIPLEVGMIHMEESDFIILNIKEVHDPILANVETPVKENTSIPQENGTSSKTQKKNNPFLSWINDANKTIETMFSTPEKATKEKTTTLGKKHSISSLGLPMEIENMTRDQLRKSVRDDINTFHSVNYTALSKDELIAAKEWHTWQVCIMLKLYKMGDKLFISNKEEIFPVAIKELSKNGLEQVIRTMILNLKKRANLNAKKSFLQKDAKWSAMEVGCLLYFILE